MKIEEGWKMYIDIKKLKEKGFSHSKIAKRLGISRPTVIKYVNMTPDEYDKELSSMGTRTKKPEKHHDDILAWLRQYPDMTAAQVFDWLEEKYTELCFNESTLRSYVRFLREKYDIPKEPVMRQYEALEDPPMGKQMQVDFGEKRVFNAEGKEIILYVMCFVLSHSRYKYCQWQARHFNTADIIRIHEDAFEYYGGCPEEAVYDQDHLILVSENHGDLIFTKEFAAYLQKRRFKVHMCRRADPESKGRIEKVVDFVKDNFASNRTFLNIDRWNENCIKWLQRRGNGKMHSTTRKIPAQVFIEEKKYLMPVTDKIIRKPSAISITYQIRKDNTVPIQGNRYTVPRGTYKGPNTYVGVSKIENTYLIIYELESGKEIARHEIPQTKGNLVVNNDHKRDKSSKIVELIKTTASKFSDTEKATLFLEEIRAQKPRYTRDQIHLIETTFKIADKESLDNALDYCIKNKLFSAVDFRDAVNHYNRNTKNTTNIEQTQIKGITSVSSEKMAIKAQVRDISEYTDIMNNRAGGR
ncbi:MAG: IS21 family transposase [Lutispora sp.]|nr:IS21 family transposase [Lutispora sp.]